jgi:hypothetical protein
MDPDCTQGDLKHCDVCNDVGGCNRTECPGTINPKDITSCNPAPAGWTCSAFAYGDGKTCDCGCGIKDKDCPDDKLSSCQNCLTSGSCGNGACPSSIAPSDTTRCETPARWTCDTALYGNGTCDCGCGAKDIDCPDSTAAACQWCGYSSCAHSDCSLIDSTDNAFCTVPPYDWTCSARLYRDGTQCDCSAQPCPGLINPTWNAACSQPPPPTGWTCPPENYGDGYACDCGCGVRDVDCRTNQLLECVQCNTCGGNCQVAVDPADTTKCLPPPSGWTCSAQAYNDGSCDCGCGIPDVACGGAKLLSDCGNFPVEGCSGGNASHIDPQHNERCSIGVPTGWTCNRAYFDDGLCDCGCGATDRDCASAKRSACAKCDDAGSCSTAKCPGTILVDDNAHCGN